jgi:two-component sensor histidine kinase/DNA-binding NarL/FixJ family response regulator
LLIEDKPGDARLIHFMLWEAPGKLFSVDHADRLSAGLERITAGGIDLILLDLHLPDSKGLDTFLSVYEQAPDIPIVLLTGLNDESVAVEAMRHGAQDYLVKGQIDGEMLARAIRYAIERKRVEKELYHYTERLKTLREIDQSILTARSPEAIAMAALGRIRRLVPCQRTIVLECDENSNVNVLAVEVSGRTNLGTLAASAAGARDRLAVFDTQTFHHIEGVEDLEKLANAKGATSGSALSPLQRALYEEGVRSYLLVPLVVYGELVGALSLESHNPNIFTSTHVEIASEVAASLAVAVRQARLHEQARRDAETKSVLLREVNHRVKNNLSAIVGFLYAEQSRAELKDQPAYQTIIRELITRVQGLSTVHTLLSASEWAPLSLSTLAIQVIRSALDMIKPGQRVTINVAPAPVRVTSDQAHHLALIINELTTNTAKHALGGRDTAHIDVHIETHGDRIHFEFRDDGPGYPEDILRLNHYNVGFELITNIVHRSLRGKLSLSNDGGAVAFIDFKAKVNIDTSSRESQAPNVNKLSQQKKSPQAVVK